MSRFYCFNSTEKKCHQVNRTSELDKHKQTYQGSQWVLFIHGVIIK
jgi:hypothetical protein